MTYHNLLALFTGFIGKSILKAAFSPIPLPITKAVSLVVLITVLFVDEKFMLVLPKAVLLRMVLFDVPLLYSWEVTIIKDVIVIITSNPMRYINELFI
jgi:hypothetical protein